MFELFELNHLNEILEHYAPPLCVQKHSWAKLTFFVAKRFEKESGRLIGIIFPENEAPKWCFIEKLDRKYRVVIPHNAEHYYKAAGIENAYDEEGYDQFGFDKDGFDRAGYNSAGYDRQGLDRSGFDDEGFDAEGYNHKGYDRDGYTRQGLDRNGHDRDGYDRNGFDYLGIHRETGTKYNRNGFAQDGSRKRDPFS